MSGGFDVQALLAQAQLMREQLTRSQQELAELRVEGSAGGGLVVATLTGEGELVGLVIAPSAVDPDDTETLADLVVAAVRDAREQVARASAERMAPVTEGLGGLAGGIPGLTGGAGGLGELFGGPLGGTPSGPSADRPGP